MSPSPARWLALGACALSLAALPARGASVGRAYAVVDLSVHLPYQLSERGQPIGAGTGQADVVRMRRGGVTGVVLPLLGPRRGEPTAPGLEPSYLGVFRGLADSTELRIPGCRRPGPGIRTWLAIEGAGSLAATPTAVGLWATRGVRLFGLTREEDNELASSAHSPAPTVTGLTAEGRELVRRIHEAGAMVDVTHASAMTIRDVVELARDARAPVVASHVGARALVDDARNLTDGQLRDLASTGGVVGISFNPRLLARGRRPELKDVVRHVRHAVAVAGVDHVALGSSYEGGIYPPHELLNAARFPRLARALEDAGMHHEVIRKVFAGNALRVLCPPHRPRAKAGPTARAVSRPSTP